MKTLYFSFIYSFINHENVAWYSISTNRTDLFNKQKQAIKAFPIAGIQRSKIYSNVTLRYS